jgi:hypothetical protein
MNRDSKWVSALGWAIVLVFLLCSYVPYLFAGVAKGQYADLIIQPNAQSTVVRLVNKRDFKIHCKWGLINENKLYAKLNPKEKSHTFTYKNIDYKFTDMTWACQRYPY